MTQGAAGSAAATAGPALSGAGAAAAGFGAPQASPFSGDSLGIGGSRVASAAVHAAGTFAGGAGQVVSGMAGRQLPLTKSRRDGG